LYVKGTLDLEEIENDILKKSEPKEIEDEINYN